MSKINKIRFVNLNYNNNTMRIDDETFYLDGDNAMLNLRNGGGKSVIVQMVMAPFVNRRHRTLKDRNFDSYFTSSTPTYIMVEWKLDDGAGYLLTGMMVRKKESVSDENSKEKLDIINFVNEYRSRNSYDIDSIPIIEKKVDSKLIKSFTHSKKLFEDLKKDRNLKFNYYDMNNPVTTRSYFSKLQEYKINYKEWETIIKQINLKESGLSELFTKAKDSVGLVKDWFLPAIENKLNKDEDRIKNYVDLVNSYIKQYKDNKSKIDRKEKIELFNELSKELLDVSDEFILAIGKRKAIENTIANIIEFLKLSYKDKINEEQELEKLINDLYKEINELSYEKESISIYNKEDEIKELEGHLEQCYLLVNESESKIDSLNRKINILECAKIHRDYQNKSKELQQLETELRILGEKNKDNAPKINNLGFTIKAILNGQLNEVKESLDSKQNYRKNIISNKESEEKRLSENRRGVKDLLRREGSLKFEISYFDKVEVVFNKKFNENLSRNISGFYYDEDLITFEKEINERKFILEKEKKEFRGEYLKSKEELKSSESEKIKNIELKSKVNNSLDNKKKELANLNDEIEKYKETIKYIEFTEDKIFNKEEIISAFDKKINLLKEEELNLVRRCDKLVAELEKLKGGKVLELSKELEEKFKNRDISIKYGMEWLRQNDFSYEKNIEIVKRNPFIPYSLIMNEKDIESLEKDPLDVFTSTPISIINRVDLEKGIEGINKDIVSLKGINFFVSFNNKLLNEVELIKLIESNEKELEIYKKMLADKREGVRLYEDKRSLIIHSLLDKKNYIELKETIEDLEVEFNKLRQREIDLERLIGSIKDRIQTLELSVRAADTEINKNIEKSKAFKDLCDEYKSYKKNKDLLDEVNEKIRVLNNAILQGEEDIKKLNDEIENINETIRKYANDEEKLKNQLSKFSIYNEGEIIKKDIEDLLAEYDALNKEIFSSEKELKEKIAGLNLKFIEVENELNVKTDKYQLLESDYINEIYNLQRELEVKDLLSNEENNNKTLKKQESDIDKKIANAKGKLEGLYDKLIKEFDKCEPKSKELLFEKNFNEEIARLKLQIKDTESHKKNVNKDYSEINQNLTSLSEFEDFQIIIPEEIRISIDDLKSTIGKTKRDLTQIKDKEVKFEGDLNKLIFEIEIKDQFKDEALFKEPMLTLKSLTATPAEFKSQLNLVIDSYNMLMEKLLVDIDLIEKEEGKILESILEYIEEIHKNIERIDDNSSITIGGKRIKMLNISVDGFTDNKELYKIKLKEYIETIRERSLKELENNKNIEDIVSNGINTFKLYDEVIGIGNVNIKLYKIEEDRQKSITWDEVSKNSGGEGFLSAFVILSSLLSYMRKDESDIFNRKEGGKVIIMDNPFAQTSSAHLLKPLMDIAKKSNTQLICLTGLGGDEIYNRFDNIYVLNLIPSKLKSGVKYLRGNHIKGEEEKEAEVIVSSRFKIEEQVRLF
ncbi:hypothetical protein FDB23_13310 [Clostridium botulinum]|nr:hypothetical protein [Clostridium botulinum]